MGSVTHPLQENENDNENEEEEGLECGTCGDQGFTNAFIYCVKCLNAVIHRYCLDEMPKTFYERVLWCCEDCQVKSSQSRKEEEPAIAKHVKVTHINKKPNKERDIASLIAVTKEVTIKEHAKKKEDKLRNDLGNGIQESCTMVDFPVNCTPSQMKHKELIPDSSFMEEESEKNTDHECRAGTATNVFQQADIENNIQDNYYVYAQAQPFLETVWRGSFTVINAKYDFPGRIFAHLSNKALDKVFQEAHMMPSLLHLEMRPKIFLWPKSFQERGPSDESIALYFFRGDPINEKMYDHLVQDMMDKELAMSAPTKNAELLIFTSMVLPHSSQRFNGKYYLWGVFRRKRDDPTSAVSHNLTVPNSNDQPALLKRVDAAVHEPVDNPMGQPAPCERSEHISNSTGVDVVMSQPILCEGSEHIHGEQIPNNSLQYALSKHIVLYF